MAAHCWYLNDDQPKANSCRATVTDSDLTFMKSTLFFRGASLRKHSRKFSSSGRIMLANWEKKRKQKRQNSEPRGIAKIDFFFWKNRERKKRYFVWDYVNVQWWRGRILDLLVPLWKCSRSPLLMDWSCSTTRQKDSQPPAEAPSGFSPTQTTPLCRPSPFNTISLPLAD